MCSATAQFVHSWAVYRSLYWQFESQVKNNQDEKSFNLESTRKILFVVFWSRLLRHICSRRVAHTPQSPTIPSPGRVCHGMCVCTCVIFEWVMDLRYETRNHSVKQMGFKQIFVTPRPCVPTGLDTSCKPNDCRSRWWYIRDAPFDTNPPGQYSLSQ